MIHNLSGKFYVKRVPLKFQPDYSFVGARVQIQIPVALPEDPVRAPGADLLQNTHRNSTDLLWDILPAMSKRNIGLFGGTFDPPHLGHLILASEAVHQFELSKVLWVLTPDPPHKRNGTLTPVNHRVEMILRTITDNPVFEISRLELDRPGPHFTYDTCSLYMDQHPGAELTLLLGGDSLLDLPDWHKGAEIVSLVHRIGVMRRPGNMYDLSLLEHNLPGLSQKVIFLDTLLQAVSSREIRHRVAEGLPFRYYLLPSVYEYIETHGLYRAASNADLS